jgi:hypothetical protein
VTGVGLDPPDECARADRLACSDPDTQRLVRRTDSRRVLDAHDTATGKAASEDDDAGPGCADPGALGGPQIHAAVPGLPALRRGLEGAGDHQRPRQWRAPPGAGHRLDGQPRRGRRMETRVLLSADRGRGGREQECQERGPHRQRHGPHGGPMLGPRKGGGACLGIERRSGGGGGRPGLSGYAGVLAAGHQAWSTSRDRTTRPGTCPLTPGSPSVSECARAGVHRSPGRASPDAGMNRSAVSEFRDCAKSVGACRPPARRNAWPS